MPRVSWWRQIPHRHHVELTIVSVSNQSGPDDGQAPVIMTWNDLPRWVQVQRNWYRRYKNELGLPEPEPTWTAHPLSQSLKRLYAATEKAIELRGPVPPHWYEIKGDKAAADVLVGWIEHLRCPNCDMPGPADFGDEWGTVECSSLECLTVWQPEWVTPWGPPTPKSKNPKRYTKGPCPMCGTVTKRLNPTSPYDFTCKLPEHESMPLVINLLWTQEESQAYQREQEESQAAWQRVLQQSCQTRYFVGWQEGWFRFLPVWFPFCRGCGAQFSARFEDQEYCSRECGPMPKDFSRRLRKMAQGASPVLRRSEVFERDGWMCHICGRPVDRHPSNRLEGASLDHVVPIAAGGTHIMENVRTAHLHCNIKKSDTVLDEDELAFLRRLLTSG